MVVVTPGQTVSFGIKVKEGNGLLQVPGTVVTAADSALFIVLSLSQEQRVLIVWAGPVWTYVGTVDDQEPLFT